MSDSYNDEYPIIALVGPTAIGKTSLALEIAALFNCEIVSVDSMQVYRYMDIGTAKPSPEELRRIPHHLIDIVNPDDQYDSARFVTDATEAIQLIHSKGKIPLLTGGTGLYLRALFYGLFEAAPTNQEIRTGLTIRLKEEGRASLFNLLKTIDPASAQRIHENDTQRLLRAIEVYELTGIPWSEHIKHHKNSKINRLFRSSINILLTCDRNLLYRRIDLRSSQMLDQGLIREVEHLRKQGFSPELPSMQAIGYKHANLFIDGKWDKGTTLELLARDTRHYAKRQLTWFSRQETLVPFDREQRGGVIGFIDNELRRHETK